MADTQTKKERLEAEKAAEKKEMAKYRTVGIITAAFIVLALALIIFVNSNVIYNGIPAVTIGSKSYSAAEVNIAYVTEYNSYYQQIVNYVGEDNAAQFMPSTTESLKTQVYSETTGETWFDFFKGRAIESLKNYTALEAEAKKTGYTLSEEGKQSVENELASLDSYIELYKTNYNADYLQYLYGNGATRDIVKRFLELQALAGEVYNNKSDSLTYSAADLDAKYAETADDNDFFTYTIETVAAAVEAAGETATQAEVDAAMAAAKAEAEEAAKSLTAENATTTQGTYLSETYKEWLTSADRKSGDTAVFAYGESADDSTHGYYAVRFESRDDNNYTAKNVYFLAIADLEVNEDDFEKDENGNVKDTEAYEAAKKAAHEGAQVRAEEVLDAWKGDTYDTPAALAEAFSEYTSLSRELENVGKNDISDDVNAWIFDSSREEGDAEIFEISGTTYVFIYTGDGDTYAHSLIESTVRSEDMEAWSNSLMESLTATEGWAAKYIGDVYMEKQAANS
ncbi:MAG: hypothetical protein IJP43_05180 [Oscillospiraceae bacterium]|nr:hypothetical protein [Oscillospiraceae bacterium]